MLKRAFSGVSQPHLGLGDTCSSQYLICQLSSTARRLETTPNNSADLAVETGVCHLLFMCNNVP